jgi:predicted amidohydrolase YtcJ
MASGEVLGAAERLTRAQALRALTHGGAWLAYAERERGVLAPGRVADLCALDQDPLSMPMEAIESLRCRLTMVGGEVVHAGK